MAEKVELSFTFNEAIRGAYLNVFDAKAFKKNGKSGGWQPRWTAFPAGRYLGGEPIAAE